MNSSVSAYGTLRLLLSLGLAEAGQEVRGTVESVTAEEVTSMEEWETWVDAMAGSCQGDLIDHHSRTINKE